MGIEQRIALVVGGTGDIGLAICRELLALGFKVVVSGLSEEQTEAACAILASDNSNIASTCIDVTNESSCDRKIRELVATHGRLDCVVNCAGVSYIAPVLLGKMSEWRRVIEVNSLGAFSVSKAALRPMIRQRYGRIIHIGSISAEVGAPYNAIYASSKAAVAALVRSLALEVAATGITVNAVQPGYVKTKLFAQTQGTRAKIKGVTLDEHERDLIADTPTRVLVTPEDVASLVGYLAGTASSSITGQTLNVDGGRTAN